VKAHDFRNSRRILQYLSSMLAGPEGNVPSSRVIQSEDSMALLELAEKYSNGEFLGELGPWKL
jgi:hypothetical protein